MAQSKFSTAVGNRVHMANMNTKTFLRFLHQEDHRNPSSRASRHTRPGAPGEFVVFQNWGAIFSSLVTATLQYSGFQLRSS